MNIDKISFLIIMNNSIMYRIIYFRINFHLNFFSPEVYSFFQTVYLLYSTMTKYSELSEFLSDVSALYYYGFKAFDIGACFYKICDDSVRLRHFFGADNEDEIETILSECNSHSLYKFIDGD